MSQSNAQIREAIAEQASEWFIENRSGSLDRDTSARFMAWLQISPVHVETYLRVASLAPDIAAAVKRAKTPLEALLARAQADNVRDFDVSALVSVHERVRLRGPRIWALAAAAALVCVATAAIWSMRDGERFGLPRSYQTTYGEQRTQPLPDGSVLHLNTDSEVTVRYAHGERLVSVDRGQALFEVAYEARRRFRVQAGQAEIIAVGTQFDVYHQAAAIRVTVVEGAVAVYADRRPTRTVRLDAGDQLDVGEEIGTPRHVDARATVAWLTRQIEFEEEPLGAVATEFNRYSRIQLVIDDATLRVLPISGVFDAYDIDSFANFLATLNGVVVQRTPTQIRVLTAAAAERQRHSGTR
jgi:transmembrane sensor